MQNALNYAKAIAGLIGSIATALLGVLPPEEYRWLVIVGVICTTITVYAVPNAGTTSGKHAADA